MGVYSMNLQIKSAMVGVLVLWLAATGAVQAQAPAPTPPPQAPIQPVGQAGGKPVMENVFYNVLWGSAEGALIGGTITILGAKDKTYLPDFNKDALTGATYGGLIGLGMGLWMVFQGITLDPSSTPFGMVVEHTPVQRNDMTAWALMRETPSQLEPSSLKFMVFNRSF